MMVERQTTKQHHVFVYGSLKRGFGNHRLLEHVCAVHIDDGITLEPRFSMESLGAFPGVYPDGNEAIWGELYAVDIQGLCRCDSLEGHPHFYRRQEVPIMTTCGEVITAWMYILPPGDDMRLYHGYGKARVELINIDDITVANWLQPDWRRT